jgi:hypothetical protein
MDKYKRSKDKGLYMLLPISKAQIPRLALFVFISAWLSAGWFHQSRDWNTASRLMLVYSIGDRGSVSLDGLQRQTGDLAFKDGHYYCDKAPGFSLIATPPYILSKFIIGWPDHPLGQDGFAIWPADAFVTWLSSGLASAFISVLIYSILNQFGIKPNHAAAFGLMTIWASPMAVYSTLAYGHQVASALLIASACITLFKNLAISKWPFAIGLLCGFAVLTELAQAPVAIAIGLAVLASDRSVKSISKNATLMILGALPSALILMLYNFIAFGSALDMGYFHHATQQFAKVHSADNPLGLNFPEFSRLKPLLLGEYRGLLFYAPWTALAPVGWVLMVKNKSWKLLWLTLVGFIIPLWVNLSYPEWTGGWSTGPRLLVPALPWLGISAGFALQIKACRILSVILMIWGWLICSLFLGAGGRISQDIPRPFQDAVWPIWSGSPLPRFWPGERFSRTVPAELAEYYFQYKASDPRVWNLALFLIETLVLLMIMMTYRSTGSKPMRNTTDTLPG